jgi:hypothetical protein
MRIPEVREELSALAQQLREEHGAEKIADRIDQLVIEMWRKPGKKRVWRRDRAKITPELKQQIKAYARKHKNAHLHDIAMVFNVNTGSVSAILSGVRT